MPTSTGRVASSANQQLLLPLEARTETPTPDSFLLENVGNASGIRLYVNSTAATSPQTHFYISLYDYKTGVAHDILENTVIASGKLVLEMSPYVDYDAGVSAVRRVGRGVKVTVWHENSGSHTYSLTAEWLP